jgi:hypothetical protein
MMTCFGESGVPARYAGQTSWQRPHMVHASKSRRRFQENSSIFEIPSVSASSMFRIGLSAPGGVSFTRNVFKGVVIRWTK